MSKEGERSAAYALIPRLLGRVSEDMLGKRPLQGVSTSWGVLAETMERVDSVIDREETREGRDEIRQGIMNFLKNERGEAKLPEGMEVQGLELKNCLDELSDERRGMFIRSLAMIFRVSEAVKQAETVEELSFLTRLEGQLAAKLFLAFVDDELRDTDGFEVYFRTVARGARLGNMVDTLVDWPADFAEGQLKIRATPGNRFRLLCASLEDLPEAKRAVRSRKLAVRVAMGSVRMAWGGRPVESGQKPGGGGMAGEERDSCGG